MATYTKNELIVINRLKENKDFDYLMNIDFDNITIGNNSRMDKGLSKGYRMNPDFTTQFLLRLISLCSYIGPIKSDDTPISPADIDRAETSAVNFYFMLVCLDKLITKYKTHLIDGFTTKDTWQESCSDLEYTVFFMDSLSKSLRVEVGPHNPSELGSITIPTVKSILAMDIKIKDSLTGKILSQNTCPFSKVADTIEDLIREVA